MDVYWCGSRAASILAICESAVVVHAQSALCEPVRLSCAREHDLAEALSASKAPAEGSIVEGDPECSCPTVMELIAPL